MVVSGERRLRAAHQVGPSPHDSESLNERREDVNRTARALSTRQLRIAGMMGPDISTTVIYSSGTQAFSSGPVQAC